MISYSNTLLSSKWALYLFLSDNMLSYQPYVIIISFIIKCYAGLRVMQMIYSLLFITIKMDKNDSSFIT